MIKCELDKHQCDHLSFSRSSSFLTPQKCLTRSCRSAISSPGGSRLSGQDQYQDQNKEHEEEENGEDQDNLPSHIWLSGYQDQNQDQDYDESQNQNQ